MTSAEWGKRNAVGVRIHSLFLPRLKELLGRRAGAATEGRPYRAFQIDFTSPFTPDRFPCRRVV